MCPVFISQFDFDYFSVICAACHMAQVWLSVCQFQNWQELNWAGQSSCGMDHGIISLVNYKTPSQFVGPLHSIFESNQHNKFH